MIPVFVTTFVAGGYRGFFFGYVDDNQDLLSETIKLKNSRAARYIKCAKGGVFGMATFGPEAGSMVSPEVGECYIRNVSSVTPCTEEAEKAWKAAKWGE